MLDQWMWGKVSRISPEAPVPVVDVDRTTYTTGGAANVVSNLLALGCEVTVAGVVGNDDTGEKLLKLLSDQGADTQGITVSSERRTTVKTRIIAHAQQVVRVDQEASHPFSEQEAKSLTQWLQTEHNEFDGIFMSDYDKGLFTSPTLSSIWPRICKAPQITIAGPKPSNLRVFKGVDCLTLNASEASVSTGLAITDEDSADAAGSELLKLTEAKSVLVTRGEKGMTLYTEAGRDCSEPAFATQVYDVSGAGDTVLTVVGLGLSTGLARQEAIKLASHAAAVVVRKLGTATVTTDEIAESLMSRG